MAQYLVSFNDGAMVFPAEDLPDVAAASHAVVREAEEAGVWIYGGGVTDQTAAEVVATDGSVTKFPYTQGIAVIGGFSVLDVPSHKEALEWAAKFAVACRCAQEVREIM